MPRPRILLVDDDRHVRQARRRPAEGLHVRGEVLGARRRGVLGRRDDRDRPELAIEMGVRHEGRDVVLTHDGVRAAFPDATGRLVVFLHGLCENEAYWRRHRERLGSTVRTSSADSWLVFPAACPSGM